MEQEIKDLIVKKVKGEIEDLTKKDIEKLIENSYIRVFYGLKEVTYFIKDEIEDDDFNRCIVKEEHVGLTLMEALTLEHLGDKLIKVNDDIYIWLSEECFY